MIVCIGLGFLIPIDEGRNGAMELHGWRWAILATVGAGLVFLILGRGNSGRTLLRKDAYGLVGCGWIFCCAFAALPYVFCAPELKLTEAFFESVSGLTTTGATIFQDLTPLPKSLLIWRSMTEWIGGLGILGMFVLVFSSLGANGMSLFQTESSVHTNDHMGTNLRSTTRTLWLIYLGFTLICALGLWLADMTLFQAINHALTTVSTGGFSTENTSLTGFSIFVRLWVIVFMILGAISFPLLVSLLRSKRNWKRVPEHEETRTFAILLFLAFVFIFANRLVSGDMQGSLFEGAVNTLFNIVALSTTSGFGVGDYDQWPWLSKGLLLFLMIVGGCAGSTSGGLKVSRFLLWFKMLYIEIHRAVRPNLVIPLKLNGKVTPKGTRGLLFVVCISFLSASALGVYIFVALEPDKSVTGCIAAVLACLTNIGPAFDEFGPTQNYSDVSPPGMLLLTGLMLLGRLEYIAVLVLFSRSLWRPY